MKSTNTARRVGKNIRAQMTLQGFTQTHVAAVIGVSQSGVSRRLLGDIAFDVVELVTLARMFDVPASLLLGGDAVAARTVRPRAKNRSRASSTTD